jgi:hypothetical protein
MSDYQVALENGLYLFGTHADEFQLQFLVFCLIHFKKESFVGPATLSLFQDLHYFGFTVFFLPVSGWRRAFFEATLLEVVRKI